MPLIVKPRRPKRIALSTEIHSHIADCAVTLGGFAVQSVE
jgi:hypothetical protein